MSDLVDLYEYTRECNSEINEYVKESCELLVLLENSLKLESVLTEESEDNEEANKELEDTASKKVDDILDKASDNIKSERLAKTLKKTADRVKRVESIVSSISKAKVHISNTWSFKKYMDKEIDRLLKDGDIENIYSNPFSVAHKNYSFNNITTQLHQMTATMRIPAKIKIDNKGRATEDKKRRDATRASFANIPKYIASGILVDFVYSPFTKNRPSTKNLGVSLGIGDAIAYSHPVDAIKRKMSGTWGNAYETVTIGELYSRLKELDPEHFGLNSDNEIKEIRNFFSRNKKMNRLSKINSKSSRKEVKLAGYMVNLQAEYTTFRQAIANYYITIINRTFSLLNKGKAVADKIKKEAE